MKAIIFDFDGVIVQSEQGWLPLENAYFASITKKWRPEDHDRITGGSVPDTYAMLHDEYGVAIPLEEFCAWYEERAGKIYGLAPLTNGVAALIAALKERGYPLAVASSSQRSWIQSALSRHTLDEYFDCIISADDLAGAPSKPDPAIYRLAAERLNIDPKFCLAIEDATNGILAAKSAGMRCFAVKSAVNAGQDLSRADAVTDISNGFDVEELIRIIE